MDGKKYENGGLVSKETLKKMLEDNQEHFIMLNREMAYIEDENKKLKALNNKLYNALEILLITHPYKLYQMLRNGSLTQRQYEDLQNVLKMLAAELIKNNGGILDAKLNLHLRCLGIEEPPIDYLDSITFTTEK